MRPYRKATPMLIKKFLSLILTAVVVCSCSRPDGMGSGASSLHDVASKSVPTRKVNAAPFVADSLLAFSHNELIARFGAQNIVAKDLTSYLENSKYHIVVLFPATEREAEVVLEDSTMLAQVKAVIIGKSSSWATAAGVAPGMTLKELQDLNGTPFLFYGGGWEQGGYVTNWNHGKLEGKIKSCRLDRNYIMPFDLTKGDYNTHEFSSDSNDAQKGNPVVEEVTLSHYE